MSDITAEGDHEPHSARLRATPQSQLGHDLLPSHGTVRCLLPRTRLACHEQKGAGYKQPAQTETDPVQLERQGGAAVALRYAQRETCVQPPPSWCVRVRISALSCSDSGSTRDAPPDLPRQILSQQCNAPLQFWTELVDALTLHMMPAD